MLRGAWPGSRDEFAFLVREGPRFRLPGPAQYAGLLGPVIGPIARRIQRIRGPMARVAPATARVGLASRPGALYAQDGTFLGVGSALDREVSVLTQVVTTETLSRRTEWEILEAIFETISLTDRFEIPLREFLDRAHWAYGECAGAPGIVAHYAHAVNNIMSDKATREILYGRHRRKSFFEASHGPNLYYKRFAKQRDDLGALDRLANARGTIGATIDAILRPEDSPVGGARFWKGGRTAEIFQRRHLRNLGDPLYQDVTFVETGKDGKYKHFFYNLTEKGKKDLRESRERRRASAGGEADDEDEDEDEDED